MSSTPSSSRAIGHVAQQQRQRSLTRAAEADDDDASAKADVMRSAPGVHRLTRRGNLRSQTGAA